MKQSKFKQVMKEAIKDNWIYKTYKWLFKDKSICKNCKKEKAQEEYNQLCFSCYLKTLKVERGHRLK